MTAPPAATPPEPAPKLGPKLGPEPAPKPGPEPGPAPGPAPGPGTPAAAAAAAAARAPLASVPGPGTALPVVTVLLGQMNGARFLEAQLASIAAQTRCPVRLIVSDDGSADHGLMLVRAFTARHPEVAVTVLDGPGRGFAQNFLHLIRAACPEAGPAPGYVALCDQDDYWLPGRLARAVRLLEAVPAGVPALYGGRTMVCEADLTPRRASTPHTRAPSFRNALVQSIAGGNTMVLNPAAVELARAASLEARTVVSHDWWLYQIVSGVGGRVIYDPRPTVLYRQHGANLVGANNSIRGSAIRLAALMAGRFSRWNRINIAALRASAHRFTPENRATLEDFAALREAPLPARLRLLARSGLYRQTWRGDIALWIATLLRRV